MALLEGIKKGMSLLKRHPGSSSSAEADFLNLCQQNVRIIEGLMKGGNLLNERQCRHLSLKLFKTVHSIQELVFHCGGLTDLFRPALENLYRIFEKARSLVEKCCKDDWITEAVFQIENAGDFQVILLELGLCYHAIYEQAKDMSDARSFQECEDLRKTSSFRPAPFIDVRKDQDALKGRLEGVVSSQQNNPKQSVQYMQQCLARYLLVTWDCISQQSQTKELDLSRVILCMKEIESTETWGKDSYLGCGASGGVCRSTWLRIPCAKKVFHGELNDGEVNDEVNDGKVNESSFLKEAGILFHLNHPHVIKFFCCGNRQDRGDCFIAMELMERSLAKLILDQAKKGIQFPDLVAIEIIVQIARGMCYLHEMGVAHRDLKPQNVVVKKLISPHLPDQYCVKLVDFGLSKDKIEASKSNIMTGAGIGTSMYRAPEAHPDGPGKVNWFEADVYSFGSTCAHILSLKEPFGKMNLGNKYVELMNGLKPEIPATCPKKLVALLNNCWDTRPWSRPRFTEICILLEEVRHELLTGSSDSSNQCFREFIRIEVEKHSALRRQFIADTDEVIELKPTVVSIITSGTENTEESACEHLETIISDSYSATDVSSFHDTALGEALSAIDEIADHKDFGIVEQAASTLEQSEYPSARTEATMQSRSNSSDKVDELEISKPHLSEGTPDNDYLSRYDQREKYSTLVVKEPAPYSQLVGTADFLQERPPRHFFRNQCRVLEDQISIAEDILNKETASPDAIVSPADILIWPQSALTSELRRVVKLGKTVIEGCHDEPCQKAYLRQGKRTGAFAEALKEIVWCISVVYYCNTIRFFPGNLSMAMDKFPQAVLRGKELYMLQWAVCADMEELLVSLRIWIRNHSCSAEECGRPLSANPIMCLGAQISAKLANSEGDIIARLVEADHTSVLWETSQEALEDMRMIGTGSYGIVFETKWLGDTFAKEEFEMIPKWFENEANALAKLNHPHIVDVFAYSVVGPETCFFLTEFMPQDLRSYIKERMRHSRINPPFSVSDSIDVMHQISEAMSYMNSQGMVHRDLKPLNILVKELKSPELEGYVFVKLADFGLAKCKREITSHLTRENLGTTRWRAPEMFRDADQAGDAESILPRKADVYSFGIVCSEILTGNYPFHNHVTFEPREFYKLITDPDNPLRPELPESCPKSLASLIEDCWHTNPVRRPTFEVISRKLRYLKALCMIEGAQSEYKELLQIDESEVC